MARYGLIFSEPWARVSTLFLLLVWCLAGSLGINTGADRVEETVDPVHAVARRLLLDVQQVGVALRACTPFRPLASRRSPASSCDGATAHPLLGTSAVLVMVVLAAGIGMSSSGAWNFQDLSTRSWPELTESAPGSRPAGSSGTSDSSCCSSWACWPIAVADGGDPPRWAALCLAILFPLGASMTWLVADATSSGLELDRVPTCAS